MKTTTRCRRPMVETLEGRALMTAGVLDTTFGGTGLVTTQPSSHFAAGASDVSTGVAVQADLKTVVVGSAYQYYNKAWHLNIAVTRYNTDGSLDTTFGTGGVVYIQADSAANPTIPHAYSVAIQADGKIVVAGDTLVTYSVSKKSSVQRDDLLVERLNSDGSIDTTFGTGGKTIVDFPQGNEQSAGVAIQSNGDIVVAGSTPLVSPVHTPYPILVVRLTPGGSLDHTFGPNGQGFVGKSTGRLTSLTLDPSGNILVGGYDTNPSTGGTNQAVIRYTANGLLDTTFGGTGEVFLSPTHYYITGIGVQSTGQIVVSGDMLYLPNTGRTGVARLNANGTLDTSFGTNGYFYDPGMLWTGSLTVQPDDKIVIASQHYGNNTQFQVDRIQANGQSLDPTFGAGGEVIASFPSSSNAKPQQVVIGPDGKITLTTEISYFTGTSYTYKFGVARFLNDITSNTAMIAAASPAVSSATAPLALGALDVGSLFASPTRRRAGG